MNHSRNFVDPVSGVHTQAVESYWGRAKAKLKTMRGTFGHMLPGYLDEYMYKERKIWQDPTRTLGPKNPL